MRYNDYSNPSTRHCTRKTRVRSPESFHPPHHLTKTLSRFLLSSVYRPAADDDAAEGSTSHAGRPVDPSATLPDREPNPGGRKKFSKEQKKAQRGANKGRRFGKVRDELELCWRVANGATCEHGAE
jgi:tRNA-dihydrouridine synthase 3